MCHGLDVLICRLAQAAITILPIIFVISFFIAGKVHKHFTIVKVTDAFHLAGIGMDQSVLLIDQHPSEQAEFHFVQTHRRITLKKVLADEYRGLITTSPFRFIKPHLFSTRNNLSVDMAHAAARE